MTNDELAAIRARCEAATPGPWDAHANLGYCGIMAEGDKVSLLKADGCTFADGAFIAHAREDVPALLDEVDRLRLDLGLFRAENDALRAEIDRLTGLLLERETILPSGELGVTVLDGEPVEYDGEGYLHLCAVCGHELTAVRPGRWQCDYCEARANGVEGA